MDVFQRSNSLRSSLAFYFIHSSNLGYSNAWSIFEHIERFYDSIKTIVCVQGELILRFISTIESWLGSNLLGCIIWFFSFEYIGFTVGLFTSKFIAVKILGNL